MAAWTASEHLETAQFNAERRMLAHNASGHCEFPSLKKTHKQNCKTSVMRPLRVLASQGAMGFSVMRTKHLCLRTELSW